MQKQLKYNTIKFPLAKCPIFPTAGKMGHMKKHCECPNFGSIKIIRYQINSFVRQKYDTENDTLACTYCKITQKIPITSINLNKKCAHKIMKSCPYQALQNHFMQLFTSI